jgi:hypothetical protein
MGLLLLAALAVRLAVSWSPLGELDADEAVTGLMARHIALLGERPVFYWGQSYLGTLEQFSAAPLFVLFGPTTLWLKVVPTIYSLLFIALSAFVARRLFGTGPGLATAAYLAVPPAMLALWSTRARGGYAELLALGEALLLVTLLVARPPSHLGGLLRRSPSVLLALVWGVLAGLALWTHLLAVVYLVPCAAFVLLVGPRSPSTYAVLAAGFVVGASPLLIDNLANEWATFADLLTPSPLPYDPLQQAVRFFRVSVPVLAGVGVPVPPSDRTFFDRDYIAATAGPGWAAGIACLALAAALALHWPSVRTSFARKPDCAAEPALLVGVTVLVVAAITLSSYGYFTSEPRYALPAYASVPLLVGALWRLPVVWRVPIGLVVGVLHVRSLLLTPLILFSPDVVQGNSVSRAQLIAALEQRGVEHIHTDYWIGQPIMFESAELVLANVVNGGPNRNLSLSEPVSADPNSVWVFEKDSEGEHELQTRLAAAGASPHVSEVSIYRIYANVPREVLESYP